MSAHRWFRPYIALPQEHGAWIFLLSPLVIGIVAGKQVHGATLALVVCTLALFLLRQPATILVKIYAGRRPRTEISIARLWFSIYSLIALIAGGILIGLGYGYLSILILPGAGIFAWHLWLVRHRAERRQAGVEILASGVLALTAPAAFWIGVGAYEPQGWWLWGLTWAQGAASIVYAYLRLEQREWPRLLSRSERWRQGWAAAAFVTFNLVSVTVLGQLNLLARWLFVPYLLQWAETLWGIEHPAIGWKPTRIGIRQLLISTLWTLLFILTWS